MREKVFELHQEDAKNVAQGYYSLDILSLKDVTEHIKNLPYLLYDSLRISRRRRLNIIKDLARQPADAPDYSKRNYHFQTDGYFSEKSARIYEHQVETLFSGTAAPMRRMLIKLIKETASFDRPLRILELGAGVGTASGDFSKGFAHDSYTVSDLSEDYLKLARKKLPGKKFKFVKAPAESLPFESDSFDLVFSVYLFHELPRSIREKVIQEGHRVLRKGGVFAVCDSIQKDDDPMLNHSLEMFPIDYHEPFYKDYTLWDMKKVLETVGFRNIKSTHKLLSKYWVSFK